MEINLPSIEKRKSEAREGRFFLLPQLHIKAAHSASLQWNIYIVIKESGCVL